jgi:outer membrane protein
MFPIYSEENTMKKVLIAAALGLLAAGQVAAQDGSWLVRARAVRVDMSNHDETGLNLSANDKSIPEVDVSYFFNKNVAAELILTVPQQQKVTAGGTDIGTFKHLPPTLTVQYHFTDFTGFKPYVGAGFNYTKISNVNLSTGHKLDDHSTGLAIQAGVDVPLTKQVSLNFDVKKVQIQTAVYNASNVKAGTLKLDPVLIGVGVGYRF